MSRTGKRFFAFDIVFLLILSLAVLSASFSARDFSTLGLSLYKKFHDDHGSKIAPVDKKTLKKGRRTEDAGRLRNPRRDSIAPSPLSLYTATPRIIFTSQMILAPRTLAQISQSVLNL